MVTPAAAPLTAVQPAPARFGLSRRVVFRCARPKLAPRPPVAGSDLAPVRHRACRQGEVPQPVGIRAPKGLPPLPAGFRSGARARRDGPYHYATFFGPPEEALGTSAFLQQ